jgi:hypothetical protein
VIKMTQEELLLDRWRGLPIQAQEKVLEFAQFLQEKQSEDNDFGAPEHLRVRSAEQLDQMLQAGLASLDRGQGIELTDAWWETERERLIAKMTFDD